VFTDGRAVRYAGRQCVDIVITLIRAAHQSSVCP
jgi:hypothetical protein